MTHPNPSTAQAWVVVDELANRGVRLIVISPGSRSGALAIAAASHPEIETRVVVDERSAAFHGLGAARASATPVAVVATSGSAPANHFPAIVEADMSCVPLIVLSADRPAEMQGIGANQTIDQRELFGAKVRSYAGIEAADASVDGNVQWRGTVARLVSLATGARPGPVHLNVRFREPTVPVTEDGRTIGLEYPFDTPRIGDVSLPASPDRPGEEFPAMTATRGVVIAGDGDYDRSALATNAERLGWPVLATVLSGMRGREVISTYHHLLADGVPEDLRPEAVVSVGSIGPSSRLETLIAAAAHRVSVDRWGRSIDIGRKSTSVIAGDVNELLATIPGSSDPEWRNAWIETDVACRARMDGIIGGSRAMTGAGVAVTLDELDWGALVVGSSLPIREVDAHLNRSGRVFSNRGASGIDGFISTALGTAGAIPRTLALAGDLSVLHDSNGFINDVNIDLTLIVIDNGGGGLFDSLPQATHAPDYERLFVTPPHRDFADLARLHGIRYQEVENLEDLRNRSSEALDRAGLDMIRIGVHRHHDLEMRGQLDG